MGEMKAMEQEEIDRLTARLRGFQTNREYYTKQAEALPPFALDEDITRQVTLISRHMQEGREKEVISPSLVVHLWRAWASGDSGAGPWVWYTMDKGKKFAEWLNAVHAMQVKNGGAYGHWSAGGLGRAIQQ